MVSSPHGKVRIGVGSVGLRSSDPGGEFDDFVDALEQSGIDSLWLPDLVSAPGVDATIGTAWAAARTRTLKIGTGVTVLPGRNPMLLAAELASLAVLAPKRILPAFGVRAATPSERQLYPVPGRRAAVFEESLVVLRRLLSEDAVTHHGEFFTLDDASVAPRPARPLDLWLGGRADVGLRRVGRLADGWLGSFLTPDEAARARGVIGGVGQRMLASVSKRLAAEFFGNVGAAIAAPTAMPVEGSGSVTTGAPVPAGRDADTAPTALVGGPGYTAPTTRPGVHTGPAAGAAGPDDLTKGIGIGAAVALLGVLVGAAIGRRR